MPKIDEKTMLRPLEPAAISVVYRATSDVEKLCAAILEQVNELDTSTDTDGPCALLRGLTLRVKALNSVVMSYTDGDDITLKDGFQAVYGRDVGARCFVSAQQDAAALQESIYMEGVGLALEIWSAGKALDGTQQDECELAAKMRKRGQPQNNFALSAVQQVVERPALAEGFAAVLSNLSATVGTMPEPEELAQLTYAQIKGIPAKPATRRARAEAVPA